MKQQTRKKQGTLSARKGGRSCRSIDTTINGHSRQLSKVQAQKPSQLCLIEIQQTLSFIQNYQILKQAYHNNLTSGLIYQQLVVDSNTGQQQQDDDEFCFDVDLGVPYVQSHHLDSGFQYEQKANTNNNNTIIQFPKVSSAKQIFTSVLELDNTLTSQCLQEQNFTDQQQQSQSSFCTIKKSAVFKKKSRKQYVPEGNYYQREFYQQKYQQQNQHSSFIVPQNSVNQQSFSNYSTDMVSKQSIVQRLKSTIVTRENKLQYWNQQLIGFNQQQKSNKNHHHLQLQQYSNKINQKKSPKYCIESQFKQQNIKQNHQHPQPVKKRSKYQKVPIKKITTKVLQINLNVTNKQNITPSRFKLQTNNTAHTKTNSYKDQNTSHNQKFQFQQDSFPSNKTKKSLSKDRSIVRKVF